MSNNVQSTQTAARSDSAVGFQGFICEVSDEQVYPAECLACARTGAAGCPMTAPVVRGILDNLRPDDPATLLEAGFGRVTVTTLLGCVRKARLRQTHPYWLKPSQLWWAYRGQLLHHVAARYVGEDEQAIAERRFSILVEADGQVLEISGQPDLVLLDRRHLLDYKTTNHMPQPWKRYVCPTSGAVLREGQWAVRTKYLACDYCSEGRHVARKALQIAPPRAYRSHIHQVSLYRLLLSEHGIEVQTAEIVYLDMAGQLRVPVELLPEAEAWAILEHRVALWARDELPDMLSDEGDRWECEYCAVRTVCEALQGQADNQAAGAPGNGSRQREADILKELGY